MIVKDLLTPRLWLFVLGAIGVLFTGYFVIAASQKPKLARTSACKASVADRAPQFIAGEMEDFVYAFTPRRTPDAPFQFEDRDMTLIDFRGKTILVNFWATWCAPCLKELPSLNALQGELGSDKFEVVAVAADPMGPKKAQEYLDRLNINNLKLYTDEKLALASAIGSGTVLPVSILYDRDGAEIGRLVGEANWAGEDARRLVGNAINCS